MTHYLDTSAFVAWFDPQNPHCRTVMAWRERQSAALTVTYNRILQLEARHYLRRISHTHAALAWNAFRAWEGARLYEWQRLDFSALFEQAEDLSQQHKPNIQCGFWDLVHIVAARKAEVPFVTCDTRQDSAATVIGVRTTLLEPRS